MLRLRSFSALVATLAGAGLLVASCGEAPVAIGLVMHSPQGLLDEATAVGLSVFDATGATCNADGTTSAIPEGAQQFELSNQGCAEGVAWCGEITLDRDNSVKMFAVVASNAAGIVAQGCAAVSISQDPVVVDITVVRYVEPGCCNDGIVQATETCDTGVVSPTDCSGGPGGACVSQVPTEVCECDCQTREIPIDRPKDQTVPPAVERFADVALTFAPGSGEAQNGLRGVYVDQQAAGGADLFVRALRSDLSSVETPISLAGPLELPINCSAVTSGNLNRTQFMPAIASVSPSATAIVFASDLSQVNQYNIMLNHQTADGCAELPPPQGGTQVNQQAGGCSNPAVAASGGRALVVWEQNGQILGRVWDPTQASPDDLGPQLTIAANGAAPRVAGGDSGWVVVYQGGGGGDPDGIIKRSVNSAGTVGAEARVNTVVEGLQDLPDVAMFADGRHAVVWHSATDVFFQRFDAAGAAVAGDQDAPIHTLSDGEQLSPTIAASVGLGSFYAVAWVHLDSGHVHARYLGVDGGFGFNNVDGQNTDFLASHPNTPGARRQPAVAIGGDGFVVFGWHDASAEHPGVFVRRFPLPPE